MSDKDRKEWELTDEERRMVALSVTPDKLPDAMAKVAARKALEWAAKKFEAMALERTHSHCFHDSETNAYECSEVIEAMNEEDDNCAELLRKELTDG